MIKALENPHFKKIWEEVNWKIRHPEAKSLEEALKMEFGYKACIVEINDREFQYTNIDAIEMTKEYSYMEDGGFEILQILCRPITLFDILNLLNINKEDRIYIANGAEIHKIPDGKFCDFTTNLLEEQSHEAWEKISELINQK